MSSIRIPILCFLFVVVWSSGWIGSKYLLNFAGTLGALAWRYALVVVVLSVALTLLRQWQPFDRKLIWHQATIGLLSHTGFLSLSVAAIEFGVNAGMVSLIAGMQPLFTLALAYPVLRERINMVQTAGVIVGLVAVFLVVGEKVTQGASLLVYCLPFLSVLSLTLATVLCRYSDVKTAESSSNPPPLLLILMIQSSAACIGFCLLAWMFGSFSLIIEPKMFVSLFYMSVVVSIGSYFLYFYLLRELSAVKVASLSYLTPPVTMVLGWIWFREELSTVDLISLLIASIAVILVVNFCSEDKENERKRATKILLGNIGSKTDPGRINDQAKCEQCSSSR